MRNLTLTHFLVCWLAVSAHGKIQGRLFEHQRSESRLLRELKPLDLILVKNPSVSSNLIPGYFSHSSIYLGNEIQLRELGLWNHPSLTPFHSSIQSGRVILEATPPRVRLISIHDLLDTHEILVLQKEETLKDLRKVADAYSRGLAQFNKPFDFIMSLDSENEIFCAELIRLIFKSIKWPTRYGFGVRSMMPDNIAEVALHKNSPFYYTLHINNLNKDALPQIDRNLIAKNLKYVLRKSDGTAPTDATSDISFWKKEVVCFGLQFVEKSKPDFLHIEKSGPCLNLYRSYSYFQYDSI